MRLCQSTIPHPEVDITSIEDGALYSLSGTSYLPLHAEVVDAEHSEDELNYTWQVFFHHNDHYHPEFPIDDKEGVAIIDPAGCGDEEYYYRVRLDVEDAAGLTGFDEVYLYPDCRDPVVDFLGLSGEPRQDRISLTWEVETTNEVDEFVIERQNGQGIFEVIGQREGTRHTFDDRAPKYGTNTYRIHAVGTGGSYTFSNEVDISYPPDPPYTLTPNPVTNDLHLKMPSTLSNSIRLRLYTPSGALLYDNTWSHPAPEWEFSQSVPMVQYPQGMYYYTISDGGQHYNGSVVKVDR